MKRLTYLVSKLVEVKVSPTDECIEWPFARVPFGYGSIGYDSKIKMVHRMAYEVYYGRSIKNLICHKCDNPPCFNPLHLYDGTYEQNTKDVTERNRRPVGEDVSNARLTDGEVAQVIQMLDQGATVRAIANRFPVTRQTIWLIKEGEMWKHLSRPWGDKHPGRPLKGPRKKVKPWLRKGSRGNALSLNQVAEILELLNEGVIQVDIARQFGVAQSHISQIKLGRVKRYRHLIKNPALEPQRVRTKLSASIVLNIIDRLVIGESQGSIARDLGIAQTTVSHIYTGRTWKHLPRPW